MSLMNNGIVIGSEFALALYPILIKKVPTDLATQLLARFLTYSTLGFFLASPTDRTLTLFTPSGATRSLLLGVLTLLHVGSSYFAFQQLTAGASMTLFYTYPIWNLLGAAWLYQEIPSPTQLLLLAAAFAGVLLVGYGTKGEKGDEEKPSQKGGIQWAGIAAGLFAAITETAMYFAVRTAKRPSPFFSILELYPGALVALLALLGAQGTWPDFRSEIWAPLILFNIIVGFIGYALRFFAIPRVSTLVFSLLSFFGVVGSFLWGWLFVDEIPTWFSALGATLITAAGFGARQM